ncbi:unnamed protein product [Larinioides sclopetarius]|uniref:Cytochrome P450 n=1 Tax=Larinioides sclopetarius TaxID=280406 RepID=A0AAV1YRL0_9ARAC
MIESFFSQYVNSTTWTLLPMLAVFVTVLLISRYITEHLYIFKKLPPGPWGLPIFGHLFFLRPCSHLKLTQLGEKYGPIYQIFLGSKRVVVISDPDLVKEAFGQLVFSGRPDTSLTKLIEGYGIINSGGPLWQEQRRFLFNALRDFGARTFGPKSSCLEFNIRDQVSELLVSLNKANESKIYIRPMIARAVSNVIGTLLMGVTFNESDEGFKRLLFLIEDGFKHLTVAAPVNFIPILRYLPIVRSAYKTIQNSKKETDAYFAQVAEDHRNTDIPRYTTDFVDRFFAKQGETKDGKKETFFSDQQLHQVMADVFSAGLETVTSTLEWAVVFLVRHKDVQRRIQEEIDSVIGYYRIPELSDWANMPYTEAFYNEVLRRANVIPLGNTHASLLDTQLGGYFIPKGTHIIPNLWAMHMNPDVWDSPEEFRPERFLVDGCIKKPGHFMPFSTGKRMCIGDTLTHMEVFLFVTGILQKFDLDIPRDEDFPTLDAENRVSLAAKPFKICALQRQFPALS